jgi:hypothetical protein
VLAHIHPTVAGLLCRLDLMVLIPVSQLTVPVTAKRREPRIAPRVEFAAVTNSSDFDRCNPRFRAVRRCSAGGYVSADESFSYVGRNPFD